MHGFTPRQIEYGMRVNEAPGVVRMARRYSWRGAVVADDSGGFVLNEICVSVVNALPRCAPYFIFSSAGNQEGKSDEHR